MFLVPNVPTQKLIKISIAEQRLIVLQGKQTLLDCTISTAKQGAGELNGSGKTPRGWHEVVAKIGQHQPLNAVFVGRRPTGEIYTDALAQKQPERDWILTRILWLRGLEVGKNRLHKVDSMRRYIYIHGTADTEPMGVAQSHGCIRMRNVDILNLFALVAAKTPVLIQEERF